MKIDHYEMYRLWLESLVISYDIHKFLNDNKDNAYTIDEIFDVVIAPFYSNSTTFFPLVKAICEYWVIEGDANCIEMNGELFYHEL